MWWWDEDIDLLEVMFMAKKSKKPTKKQIKKIAERLQKWASK